MSDNKAGTREASVDALMRGAVDLHCHSGPSVMARLVDHIDHDALLESQQQLITVAAGMDPHQLGDWVRHQIATHCEPQFEDEQARAHDKRYLTHRREADGSLRGNFRIAAEDSETYLTALEPLARKDGDSDRRSAGQRRADALVDLCEQVLRHGDLPDAGGQRPQLSYVLPADWAAAQQAGAACTDCGPRCERHRPDCGPRCAPTGRSRSCSPSV